MELLKFFKRHRNIQKETVGAIQVWFDTAFQVLDMVMGAATREIEKKVKTWNLENTDLLYTLGYIAGFLDAAYQRLPARNEYNESFVDVLFLKAIERYLTTKN